MSKWISSEGEYSDHELAEKPRFTCARCFVFDEDAALKALEEAEAKLDAVNKLHQRDIVMRDYCSECSDFGTDEHPMGRLVDYPCQTKRALGGDAE